MNWPTPEQTAVMLLDKDAESSVNVIITWGLARAYLELLDHTRRPPTPFQRAICWHRWDTVACTSEPEALEILQVCSKCRYVRTRAVK